MLLSNWHKNSLSGSRIQISTVSCIAFLLFHCKLLLILRLLQLVFIAFDQPSGLGHIEDWVIFWCSSKFCSCHLQGEWVLGFNMGPLYRSGSGWYMRGWQKACLIRKQMAVLASRVIYLLWGKEVMESIFLGTCGFKNVKKGFEVRGWGSENVINFFIPVLQQSPKLS